MEIYRITNLVNGKIYVGKLWKNDPNYFGSGLLIKRAIVKHGIENFNKDILWCGKCSQKLLNEKEQYWIKQLRSQNKLIGYNISPGGNGGDTLTNNPNRNIICEKISASLKGNQYAKGMKHSEETKRKISKALKGKKRKSLTDKQKKKISEGTKRAMADPKLKKHLSDQAKKRGQTNKDFSKYIHVKKYKIVSPDNEVFIIENLSQFCRKHKLEVSNLCKVSKGKLKHLQGWKCKSLSSKSVCKIRK